MTAAAELQAANKDYASSFTKSNLGAPPRRYATFLILESDVLY